MVSMAIAEGDHYPDRSETYNLNGGMIDEFNTERSVSEAVSQVDRYQQDKLRPPFGYTYTLSDQLWKPA